MKKYTSPANEFFLQTEGHTFTPLWTNVIVPSYAGSGNITSFFLLRGNLVVEVVTGWACFHSRDEILKFPWKYSQSLSCVGVVRNSRLPLKPTIRIDCM